MYHICQNTDDGSFFIMRLIKGGYEMSARIKTPYEPFKFNSYIGEECRYSLNKFLYNCTYPENPYQLNYSCECLEDIQTYFNAHPELFV